MCSGGSILDRHCEEPSDDAIQLRLDRHAPLRGLAMTVRKGPPRSTRFHHALRVHLQRIEAAGMAVDTVDDPVLVDIDVVDLRRRDRSSEERRVGKACVRTVRYRWWRDNFKKKS